MGLSSKEVSGDHHRDQLEWTQTLLSGTDSLEFPKPRLTRRQLQQQQQPDPLKCPRCESANTKFCYYNNYNKSQPRHFCKACKRHWTNGGTLRNVPVGGGRKNKRLKRPGGTTTTTTVSAATTTDIRSNAYLGTYNFPLGLSDDQTDKIFDIKSIGSEKTNGGIQELYTEVEGSTWDMSGGFTGCTVQLPQNPSLGFSAVLSSLSSFDTEPSSILSNSFSSLNGNYKYVQKPDNVEDSTIIATTIMPSSQQWQVPSTSNFMEMPSYWNWNDVDTLVLADLNKPWDDSEFKP